MTMFLRSGQLRKPVEHPTEVKVQREITATISIFDHGIIPKSNETDNQMVITTENTFKQPAQN